MQRETFSPTPPNSVPAPKLPERRKERKERKEKKEKKARCINKRVLLVSSDPIDQG